jgi:hypothetical protein
MTPQVLHSCTDTITNKLLGHHSLSRREDSAVIRRFQMINRAQEVQLTPLEAEYLSAAIGSNAAAQAKLGLYDDLLEGGYPAASIDERLRLKSRRYERSSVWWAV